MWMFLLFFTEQKNTCKKQKKTPNNKVKRQAKRKKGQIVLKARSLSHPYKNIGFF